ncbi:uncharacterized protein LOC110716606 isoform X4 [Chenopodium quinoa]|uniref:uncharacterized protein LOC110716606 isoform X4 n=1 Tax=Chenopodium quinoa TaxID=63459 RepID=UPI000B79A019|nr:uncharacterized protein LOC110716606 isoform X4 [Chenopodium quinoa]XP_021750945.1 uncharacterized protein LOC110716606 isoform X4 [Chenopodium quinoa]
MVGRGGGKNVCNRKQDGKGEHVRSSNLVQNGGNYNVPRRSMNSSNQIQSMGNCDLPNQNALGSLNHLEHCQTHDDNMISNENQIQNESEGCISPHVRAGTTSKRKRKTNLVGRMNMTLEATNALDPPIRRDEENRGFGENSNRWQVGNNGSIHSVVNGETTRDGEATSKVKQRGERGKYKSYVVDMKIKGKKSKLQVYIPDDIDRAIGENAHCF